MGIAQVTLEATVMFSSTLRIWGVLFFTVSVLTISSTSSIYEGCQNMLDAFEYLTLKDKLDFFEDDQLFRKYKFCLQYSGNEDSIDDGDFDFGIKNEVDYWSSGN